VRWILLAALPLSVACGSAPRSGADDQATSAVASPEEGAPRGASAEESEGSYDRSTPNASSRSLYRAVRDHDYGAVAEIMGQPGSRAELEEEFRREREYILDCLDDATVADTRPVEGSPRQQQVRLEGCPAKRGFTGRVERRDDGTWTIVRL